MDFYETTNRGYDVQIGKFLQVDPLAEWAFDMSPYTFANNNPILLNDPSGLISDTTNPEFINTPKTAPVLTNVIVHSTKTKLVGGPFDGKYFGDIKNKSKYYYGFSSSTLTKIISNQDFLTYLNKLREELDLIAKLHGWGSALSGGSVFDLKSVKDYKDIVKKLKKMKKTDLLKINGLWMSIGSVFAWRSSQYSDMKENLIEVLINYNMLHANDPSGQKGIYKITKSDMTGTMGGIGGHEEESYYDIYTKKYLGGTSFRL